MQPFHPLSPPSPLFLNLSQHWSFPMSRLFAPGGQSVGASTMALVLPVNIQGWFPWGLTGLISLLSKRLSRVFSNAIVWKHLIYYTTLFCNMLPWKNTYYCFIIFSLTTSMINIKYANIFIIIFTYNHFYLSISKPYSENVIFHRFHQLDKGMAQKCLNTPALLNKIFVKIRSSYLKFFGFSTCNFYLMQTFFWRMVLFGYP